MAPLPLQKPPDVRKNRQGGICHFLNLQEDNVRFILLAILLYIYLAVGAFVFQAVEESTEDKLRNDFQHLYDEFVYNFTNCYYPLSPVNLTKKFQFLGSGSSTEGELENEAEEITSGEGKGVEVTRRSEPLQVTLDGLHELLFAYGNATQAGVLWQRKRWDWVGSFHFAWTIVSTIGYGATTPRTTLGKLLIIPYGFIGCAGGLLFFNLFLERIITFLATCMRRYRLQRQKRRPCIDSDLATDNKLADPQNATSSMAATAVTITVAAARNRERGASPSRSSTGEESTVEQADWKPSVYWVMLCLFVMSFIVIGSSGILFQNMEGWTFGESIYFSFVSYATIGLGDYVSLQKQEYGPLETLYRGVAMVMMVFGCCCIYSLLNVTSIVIKQLLNYIIKKLDECGDCSCCVCCRSSAARVKRRMSSRRGNRRRPMSTRHLRSLRSNGSSDISNSNSRFQIAVLNKPSKLRGGHGGRPHHLSPPQSHLPSDFDYEDEYEDLNSEGGAGVLGGSRFDLDERRCSGENMISIRGELSNKVSLAVLQKRLYETAQMGKYSSSNHYNHSSNDYGGSFSASSVGPLAIVTEKLGDNQV